MPKNNQQKFLLKAKRAIYDYGMIEDDDRIAVGLSGGKDSVTLLYTLYLLKKSLPVKFEIEAVFINPGWPIDIQVIVEFCHKLNVPFHIVETDIGKIVFEERKDGIHCALCSHLRRGALHSKALELGCRKVALGHHLDDVIETYFLNMIYTGQMRVFAPATFLDRTGLTMIRPMVYHPVEEIVAFMEAEGLPHVENYCPANGYTNRDVIKSFLNDIIKRFPDFKARFLTSLKIFDSKNLWPKALPKKGNS